MELGKDILYLPRADVGAADIPMRAVIEAVERMFAAKAGGGTLGVPKQSLHPGDGRLLQAMIAAADEAPFAAVKCVGVAPDNAALGLPHVSGLVVLFDKGTGVPAAIMDATWITAVRTAAMTAAAARHLARADAASVGFVACGVQARSHLAALEALFPIARVRAFSRRPATAEAFAAEARARGLEAEAVEAPREAVTGLDIVVTSVPAAPGLEPFLDPDWLAPGSFASLVDLGRSWRAEGFGRVDRVVVDDREHGAGEGARRLAYKGPFHADLGELAAGLEPGRRTPAERTLLIFQGTAIADLAVALLVLERAQAQGLGTLLPL